MNLEQAKALWHVGDTKAKRHCEMLQQFYPAVRKIGNTWSIPEGVPIPMDKKRIGAFARYHLCWLNNHQECYDWIACDMTSREDLNLFSLLCYDLVLPPNGESPLTVGNLVLSEAALSCTFKTSIKIQVNINLNLNFSLIGGFFPNVELPALRWEV